MNLNEINTLIYRAKNEAFIQFKHEAWLHITKNKTIHEFVMQNGTFRFLNGEGLPISNNPTLVENYTHLENMNKILDAVGVYFNLLNEKVRVKEDREFIYEW